MATDERSNCAYTVHSHSNVQLSPVHTSNNVEATLSNAISRTILSTTSNVASTKSNIASTLLPLLATMSNDISSFRQSRNKLNMSTLSKVRYSTINSFDIVAFFGSKVERCVDIVAGVDGALDWLARQRISTGRGDGELKRILLPWPVLVRAVPRQPRRRRLITDGHRVVVQYLTSVDLTLCEPHNIRASAGQNCITRKAYCNGHQGAACEAASLYFGPTDLSARRFGPWMSDRRQFSLLHNVLRGVWSGCP